jgi:hypothetical protein
VGCGIRGSHSGDINITALRNVTPGRMVDVSEEHNASICIRLKRTVDCPQKGPFHWSRCSRESRERSFLRCFREWMGGFYDLLRQRSFFLFILLEWDSISFTFLIFSNPEDGGSMFLRNAGKLLLNCMASHSRRQYC